MLALICVTGLCGNAGAEQQKVVYAKQGALSAQSCIDSAGPGGVCILPAGYSEALTSSLTIRQEGQTLKCESGATLTKVSNGDLITVTASGATLAGCRLSDEHAAYDGSIIYAQSVKNLTVENNIIIGAKRFGMFLRNVVHANITNNKLQGCVNDSIYGDGNSSEIEISSNTIDASSPSMWHHAIGLHSHDASSRVSQVHIEGNHITNGYDYCVEVGAFGGLHPTDIEIVNNICTQKKVPGKPGGYSLDSVDGATLQGNSYINDSNGASVLGIELVSGSYAKAINNILVGGSITINKQSFTNVDHNTITIHSSADGQMVAIYSGSSRTVGNNHNQITNNTIQISASLADKPAFGIWLQCNADAIDCSNQVIQGNTIEAINGSKNPAIRIENDYPTTARMNSIGIHGNSIKNWPHCYTQSANGVQSEISGNIEGCSSRFKN